MAAIQYSGFPKSISETSLIFKALGHPARLMILDHLVKNKGIICKELFHEIPLAQASTSGHLKILFEAGIIGYEKIQNTNYYAINPLILENVKDVLSGVVEATFHQNYDYSATYFKTPSAEIGLA